MYRIFIYWQRYFTKYLDAQEPKYKTLLKIQMGVIGKIMPGSYFTEQEA